MIDVADLGTIMTVWAHPDDETFTSGGLMAQAVANGQKVICVTATKGEKGIQDASRWPAERLGDIRAEELGAALQVLGVKTHEWLDYKDGECITAPTDAAVERLKNLIDKYRPDTIVSFGPDGLTGHPDHCAVSDWVSQATKGSPVRVLQATITQADYEEMRGADEQFNLFFNITEPKFTPEEDCALVLRLDETLIEKKYQALSAMPSQYEKMFTTLGQDNVYKMFGTEAFNLSE